MIPLRRAMTSLLRWGWILCGGLLLTACSARAQLMPLTFHARAPRGETCRFPPPAFRYPKTILVEWDLENSQHLGTEVAASNPASCDAAGNCTYILYQVIDSCVIRLGSIRAAAFVLDAERPLESMKSILALEARVPLVEATAAELTASVWSFDERSYRYQRQGELAPEEARAKLERARADGTLPRRSPPLRPSEAAP